MGACIISDQIFHQISGERSQGAEFSNGYTYSGHPVSSAAALKNIEIIENEGLLEHVRKISPYFQQRLQELGKLQLVGDTRGAGLVGCVECRIVNPNSDDTLKIDIAIGSRIDKHCQALGLIVRPLRNMCVFSPPLIITQEQINEMFNILEQGILMAAEELSKEGLLKG